MTQAHDFKEIAERLFRRVQRTMQISRTTTNPVDTGAAQTVQVKTSNVATLDALKVVYHYGFTAMLPIGTDVVILNVSGDSSNGCIVATGHQGSRPKGLLAGQVAIFDETGSQVLLDNAGGIFLKPSGGTATIQGNLVVTGTAAVDQTLTVTQDATIGGKSFLQHVHTGGTLSTNDTGIPV